MNKRNKGGSSNEVTQEEIDISADEGVSVKKVNVPTEILDPELVFGLVGPLGCNIDAAQEALIMHLRKVGYNAVVIHLTSDIKEVIPNIKLFKANTYEEKIDFMNEIVRTSGKADFLSRLAIMLIKSARVIINKDRFTELTDKQKYQAPKTAYIIRQLKREQEISTLSKVYGKKFVQVSIAVSEEEQLQSAINIVGREMPGISSKDRIDNAYKLINRDKEEAEVFGQGLINVYHAGDVFVGGTSIQISAQISRFIDAFFGSNLISPTKDEFGSNLAKTASLRTLDLSRQVGAAIMTAEGDIITLGCNEVPKPHGGNYWCDDDDPQRDIERGVEPNKLETTNVIHNFIRELSKSDKYNIDADKILKDPALSNVLKDAFVSDITEFGRITHAEMSALTDAARLGRSTAGATIYVTTFPCHNCAKHLIAAGIRRIVYIEPYAKSKAFELSGDALTTSKNYSRKVAVEHFVGISPKRYRDIFEKTKKRRDAENRVTNWQFGKPLPMVENKTSTHTFIETNTLDGFDKVIAALNQHFAPKVISVNAGDIPGSVAS